jgi:hypothetical protein
LRPSPARQGAGGQLLQVQASAAPGTGAGVTVTAERMVTGCSGRRSRPARAGASRTCCLPDHSLSLLPAAAQECVDRTNLNLHATAGIAPAGPGRRNENRNTAPRLRLSDCAVLARATCTRSTVASAHCKVVSVHGFPGQSMQLLT